MLNDEKMKKMKKTIYTIITGALFLIFVPSCNYNNETPPPVVDFTYGEIVTVQQVKALYADQLAITDYTQRVPVQVTEDWALKGIITASDKIDGNLYKEAYIEDATGGLRMVFNSTSGLSIGDSVIVKIKDLYVGDYGNFWQLGGEPYHEDDGNIRVSGMDANNNVLKTSINNPTYPVVVTITQAKSAAYLGRLVTISNVQFTDEMIGLTWADAKNLTTMNRDLEDCNSKTIIVRTSGYSYFAKNLLPTGNGSITGIVTIFSGTYQFIVRDYSEVKMTANRCGYVEQILGNPVESISQNFDSFTSGATIYITGWQNLAQVGSRSWAAKSYSGKTFAQATGYGSGLSKMVTWLITQPVTISNQKILTFKSTYYQWAHTSTNFPVEVLFSTDYNGTNLSTSTWTTLACTLAAKTDVAETFINSGNVSLPIASGKSGVIAFKYTGSSTESTSYRIDDITVTSAK
jgi:hypothetical protein